MFKDYYAILGTCIDAKPNEIKKAYKEQAIRWHPDKNPGVDTTQIMQDINEAYLILSDIHAREKYDFQYNRYNKFKDEAKKNQKGTYESQPKEDKQFTENNEQSDFNSDDDILNKWMSNARRQAVELAKQTFEDYKNITIAGLAGAGVGCGMAIYGYIISGIIFTFIILLARSCNS